jgi:hypothetical protein
MYDDVKQQKMVESEEELTELIGLVVARAKRYVEGMTRGEFRLRDSDLRSTACTYCDYASACRVAEAEAFGVLRDAIPLETESSNPSDVQQA